MSPSSATGVGSRVTGAVFAVAAPGRRSPHSAQRDFVSGQARPQTHFQSIAKTPRRLPRECPKPVTPAGVS